MNANDMLEVQTTDLSRRRFMRNALLAMLAGGSLAACSTQTPTKPETLAPQVRPPAWLRKITGEPAAVARLGAAYLAAHPDEANLETLLAKIESAMSSAVDTHSGVALDDASVVASLIGVVQDEFARGDVVTVNPWTLSLTEARLYAAASLLKGQ